VKRRDGDGGGEDDMSEKRKESGYRKVRKGGDVRTTRKRRGRRDDKMRGSINKYKKERGSVKKRI
jgi:hypothetical protein